MSKRSLPFFAVDTTSVWTDASAAMSDPEAQEKERKLQELRVKADLVRQHFPGPSHEAFSYLDNGFFLCNGMEVYLPQELLVQIFSLVRSLILRSCNDVGLPLPPSPPLRSMLLCYLSSLHSKLFSFLCFGSGMFSPSLTAVKLCRARRCPRCCVDFFLLS